MGRGLVVMALEPRVLLDADLAGAASEAVEPSEVEDAGDGAEADGGEGAGESAVAEALADHVPPATEASDAAPSPATEVVFIDSTVTDGDVIAGAVKAGIEVVTIPDGADALSFMAETLAGRTGLSAIHLVSHGEEGALLLGGTALDLGDLTARADDLSAIGGALAEGGDLLLYGCEIGAGTDGQAYLDALSTLTGADVAASDDPTGLASLGGDWDLEVSSGDVDARLAFGSGVETYADVLDVNTPATISNLDGDTVTYTEGGAAVTLDQAVAVAITDADSTDFDTGLLRVMVLSATADDDLSIDTSGTVSLSAGMTVGSVVSVGGVAIGTIESAGQDGAFLVVRFNGADATPARASTLAQAVQYQNTSEDPSGTKRIGFWILDGDGGASATPFAWVNLTAVNDAPVLSNLDGDSASRVIAGAGPTAVSDMADVTLSDVDSSDFNGGSLLLQLTSGTNNGSWGVNGTTVTAGADGTIAGGETISVGGVAIGTVSAVNTGQNGASLEIQFDTADATPARIQALIRAMTYDAPSGLGTRDFTVTVVDGDGVANGGDQDTSASFSLGVTLNPPVVSNLSGDSVSTNSGTPVLVDAGSNVTVTDADSANFSGGTLTITRTSGLSGDFSVSGSGTTGVSAGTDTGSADGTIAANETIYLNGVAIATVSAAADGQGTNALTLTLGANATPAAVQAVIRGLMYDSTTGGSHTFSLTIADSNTNAATSTAATFSVDVNVAPVNTVPGAQTAVDGQALTLGGISVSDANGDTLTTTVSVPAGAGTFAITGAAVTGGNGTNSVTLSGNHAQINAALATLTYTPAEESTGVQTITVATNDGHFTDTDTISVTVGDRPTLVNLDGDSLSVTPGTQAALDLGGNAQVTDGDSATLNGGSFKVTRVNGALLGSLSADGGTVKSGGDAAFTVGEQVTVGGVVVGTVTADGSGANNLEITLANGATPALVGQLIQGLRYTSTAIGSHAFDVTVSDSGGGVASNAARATVTVSAPSAAAQTPGGDDAEADPTPDVDTGDAPIVHVGGSGGTTVVTFEPRGGTGGPVVFAATAPGVGAGNLARVFGGLAQGQSALAQTLRGAFGQGDFGGVSGQGGFGGIFGRTGAGGFSASFQMALGDPRVLGALTRVSGLTGEVLVLQGGEWVGLDVLDALRLGDGDGSGDGGLGPLVLGDGAPGGPVVASLDGADPGADPVEPVEVSAAPPGFLEELEGEALLRAEDLTRLAMALSTHQPESARAL